MKKELAITWTKTRAGGLSRYIVKRGILGYGLPMYCMFVTMGWRDGSLARTLVINLPVWLVGGTAFGAAMWYCFERRYRRYVAQHGAPS